MQLQVTDSALRALWPQAETLLNGTLTLKGVENQGDDAQLACVRSALARNERISLSAVGGSITAGSSYAAGSGSAATFLYHRKVLMALDARFPVASGTATSMVVCLAQGRPTWSTVCTTTCRRTCSSCCSSTP